MEAIQRDYAPKGVQFVYLYKTLAHPENNGYIATYTLEERLEHVRLAQEKMGTRFDWLCDSMDNQVKHALGDRPNAEFILDPEGRFVRARNWSRPDRLRSDLEELVGPVENPTSAEDLNMQIDVSGFDGEAARGVVPRPELPSRMTPLITIPQLGDQPHYVKLRAEGERELVSDGSGRLYLGFFLDPIYGVHWNNLVDPVHFEISPSGTTEVVPAEGDGPKVEEASDVDPREFVIEVKNASEPIEVTVRYFACTDNFCKPMTQKYTVHFEADREGGTRMSGSRRGARGEAGPPGGRQQMLDRIRAADADQDGKISRQEAPEMLLRRFETMDSNGDGELDQAELEAMMERWDRGRGGRRGGAEGPGGR